MKYVRIALLSAAAIYLLPFATPAYAELGTLPGCAQCGAGRDHCADWTCSCDRTGAGNRHPARSEGAAPETGFGSPDALQQVPCGRRERERKIHRCVPVRSDWAWRRLRSAAPHVRSRINRQPMTEG